MLVNEKKDMPQTQHWGVFVFDTENQYEEPYDQYDKGGYRSVKVVYYYAFTKKEDWEKKIFELETRGERKYRAVVVSAPAIVEKKVSVDITTLEEKK